MSRRTSESNKAIAQAWEREKQRVSEGNGTRDWTPDQQRDILERGKAYDENGKAFEGQHMRSAEMHPECQGDPDNIQFLTREEHLAAHDGDWRNPTNWYYNPVTKEKLDFGDGPIIPCDVMELTEPVISQIAQEAPLSTGDEAAPPDDKEDVKPTPKPDCTTDVSNRVRQERQTVSVVSHSAVPPKNSGFFGFVRKAAKAAGSFIIAHKEEIIAGGLAIGGAVLTYLSESNGNGSGNSGNTSNKSSAPYSRGYPPEVDDDIIPSPDVDEPAPDEVTSEEEERNYPDERQSPREHDVSGYTRHRNGKEIHVAPYKRGGKKDE